MAQSNQKLRFFNYPSPAEGPETPPFSPLPGNNPVLSGLPLSLAATAVVNFSPLASFFYNNAGFNCLSKVPDLKTYSPRYDPTVIPIPSQQVNTEGDLFASADAAYEREGSDKGSPYRSIGDFHANFKAGKTTPSKVAEVVLGLIEKDERFRGAFISVRREEVLRAAVEATERYASGKSRGVLDGVPIAVKDEIDLAGHPTTSGTKLNFAKPDVKTSWCIQQWLDAGAIIIGKLNMHECGFDTNGNNPNPPGTPRNPHSPSHHYPGGSSSASATTVSANLLPLTLGCDGGGSIRIPSGYCGIYGLKPTHGRVSISPTVGLAASTGVAGPMASSIADLELGYRIMSNPHPSSSFTPAVPPSPPSLKSGKRVLGICRPWFNSADEKVQSLCSAALRHYESLGWEIVDISIPYLHEGQVAHALTISSEITTAPFTPKSLTAANQIYMSMFACASSMDFLLAQKLRQLLMSHMAFLWEKYPGMLIVSPTTPNAGWRIGSEKERTAGLLDGNTSVKNMQYVWMANFLGTPAIGVPVGVAKEAGKEGRVPVGLMAMGEWGDEDGLIEWGKVAERWAWEEGSGGMERPEIWVDVLAMASER